MDSRILAGAFAANPLERILVTVKLGIVAGDRLDELVFVGNDSSSICDSLLCLVEDLVWCIIWVTDDDGFLGLGCRQSDSNECQED